MRTYATSCPPVGVHLCTDVLQRGSRVRARVRWTDPSSRERRSRSVTVDNDLAAQEFFELVRASSNRAVDPLITLSDYARSIGGQFLRGVDPTSTAAGYRAGLQLRVLPKLGHLRVGEITTGLIDRTIDTWETTHSRSTLKNTIAALTRVLDEAVRDDLIARNPVRDRADRRYRTNLELPRTKLFPGPNDVARIAEACEQIHTSYGDHVMLSAFLAARSLEVGGLLVGHVDWRARSSRSNGSASRGRRPEHQTRERSSRPPRTDHRTARARAAQAHNATVAQPATVARAAWRCHHHGNIA